MILSTIMSLAILNWYYIFASRNTDKARSSLYVELMLHLMHVMDKDWFGVFFKKRLHAVFLFSAWKRNNSLLG